MKKPALRRAFLCDKLNFVGFVLVDQRRLSNPELILT
jgi:hypothetical protein